MINRQPSKNPDQHCRLVCQRLQPHHSACWPRREGHLFLHASVPHEDRLHLHGALTIVYKVIGFWPPTPYASLHAVAPGRSLLGLADGQWETPIARPLSPRFVKEQAIMLRLANFFVCCLALLAVAAVPADAFPKAVLIKVMGVSGQLHNCCQQPAMHDTNCLC